MQDRGIGEDRGGEEKKASSATGDIFQTVNMFNSVAVSAATVLVTAMKPAYLFHNNLNIIISRNILNT